MKVFFDHQIYVQQQFGGISRYFNELMKMESHGIEVAKLDPALASMVYGSKTDLYSRGLNYVKRKTGVGRLPGQKEADLRIMQQLTDTSFDIFHPTYYDTYFLDSINKPFVLTVYDMIHEIFYEYFQDNNTVTHNKRILCDKAAAIIAISENTKRDIVNIFQVPEEKVHAIQLASDFDTVTATTPAGSGQWDNFILFTGNRWGYKNFYLPVMALAGILKKDSDVQLLCTGHPFTKAELQFFKDLGIENKVKHIFLKDDGELAWAYQHAAFFIFPSLYEGFGFPLLEAFGRGCPVISSNGGSLPEVGGNGALYFNPKSIPEIREAAQQVLYNTGLKNDLINKGRTVFKKFSWERCRQQTIEVYRSL
ncbi:MAG: glycosyltransferase family 1 protein [Chitinophagaceae bacterium]